jgi:hypothetical protein
MANKNYQKSTPSSAKRALSLTAKTRIFTARLLLRYARSLALFIAPELGETSENA